MSRDMATRAEKATFTQFRQIPRFRHKKEPPGSPRSGGFGRSCCLNLGFCAGRQGCRGMGCRPAGLTESTNNHSSPTIQRPSERHTAAATALMDRSSPRFDGALRQLNLYIMVLLRERSRRIAASQQLVQQVFLDCHMMLPRLPSLWPHTQDS